MKVLGFAFVALVVVAQVHSVHGGMRGIQSSNKKNRNNKGGSGKRSCVGDLIIEDLTVRSWSSGIMKYNPLMGGGGAIVTNMQSADLDFVMDDFQEYFHDVRHLIKNQTEDKNDFTAEEKDRANAMHRKLIAECHLASDDPLDVTDDVEMRALMRMPKWSDVIDVLEGQELVKAHVKVMEDLEVLEDGDVVNCTLWELREPSFRWWFGVSGDDVTAEDFGFFFLQKMQIKVDTDGNVDTTPVLPRLPEGSSDAVVDKEAGTVIEGQAGSSSQQARQGVDSAEAPAILNMRFEVANVLGEEDPRSEDSDSDDGKATMYALVGASVAGVGLLAAAGITVWMYKRRAAGAAAAAGPYEEAPEKPWKEVADVEAPTATKVVLQPGQESDAVVLAQMEAHPVGSEAALDAAMSTGRPATPRDLAQLAIAPSL